MAELNKLTDKILEEAKVIADGILNEAKEKASKITESSKNQSEAKYNAIVEKGAREASSHKDRLVSNANLKARDNELKAKQEVIQKVYEAAIEDLINIDSDKFLDYLKKNASFSNESILVVPANKVELVKNNFPDVKISSDRNTESGFIEIVGGIEKNFTFTTQLEYIKDEVQSEIAKVLFK